MPTNQRIGVGNKPPRPNQASVAIGKPPGKGDVRPQLLVATSKDPNGIRLTVMMIFTLDILFCLGSVGLQLNKSWE